MHKLENNRHIVVCDELRELSQELGDELSFKEIQDFFHERGYRLSIPALQRHTRLRDPSRPNEALLKSLRGVLFSKIAAPHQRRRHMRWPRVTLNSQCRARTDLRVSPHVALQIQTQVRGVLVTGCTSGSRIPVPMTSVVSPKKSLSAAGTLLSGDSLYRPMWR